MSLVYNALEPSMVTEAAKRMDSHVRDCGVLLLRRRLEFGTDEGLDAFFSC
jgi:hypothetical protein